jgi:hypothetical protein
LFLTTNTWQIETEYSVKNIPDFSRKNHKKLGLFWAIFFEPHFNSDFSSVAFFILFYFTI